MTVFALIVKEWKLLLRDWHALLLLFAMPAMFILVMSLALQDKFVAQQGVSLQYYLVNEDSGPASETLMKRLATLPEFKSLGADAPTAELVKRVQRDRAQFLVKIPRGFGKAMLSKQPVQVQMLAGPGVQPAVYQLFAAALRDALAHVYLQQTLAPLTKMPGMDAALTPNLDAVGKLLHEQSLYKSDHANQLPTSVQQNVPAWLLFAMFFIAIPLSTTWVQERQQGTYARLRSMGLGAGALLAGKLVPYLCINLLQVVLMLAVGVYLVPWLGGDSLTLGHAPLALCLMALAGSFASVGYALLIANWVTTADQAMIFSGVANLLMAALGGIMVPRFLMPPLMQTIGGYSPMAWGLEGFLDVFLRGGGLAAVAPEAVWLFIFGLVCLLIAGWRFNSRNKT